MLQKKNIYMKNTIAILAVTFAIAICGVAQSQTTHFNSPVGIGIWTAYGDLHLHESTYTEPVPGIEPDNRDTYPGDYYTTFRMTNTRHQNTKPTDSSLNRKTGR